MRWPLPSTPSGRSPSTVRGGIYDDALALGAGERALLLRRAGEALANAGRGADAAARFLELADCTDDGPTNEAHVLRRRAAEQLLRSGRFDEGIAAMRAVLSDVGLTLPSTPRAAGIAAIGQHLRLLWRGFSMREPASRR
jgi:hypothetical protein